MLPLFFLLRLRCSFLFIPFQLVLFLITLSPFVLRQFQVQLPFTRLLHDLSACIADCVVTKLADLRCAPLATQSPFATRALRGANQGLIPVGVEDRVTIRDLLRATEYRHELVHHLLTVDVRNLIPNIKRFLSGKLLSTLEESAMTELVVGCPTNVNQKLLSAGQAKHEERQGQPSVAHLATEEGLADRKALQVPVVLGKGPSHDGREAYDAHAVVEHNSTDMALLRVVHVKQ
mmetsp:Transcript_174921/g.560896  ORF Transcript_174921/g.560896 Transcript_174921/m.560896 type:complete len:233 (+) Transcript_174921:1668-2366(+)